MRDIRSDAVVNLPEYLPSTGSRKHRAGGPAADYALTIKPDQSDQATQYAW